MIDNIWYNNLNKSRFTPPKEFFKIIWIILYVMIFVSFIIYITNNSVQINHITILFFIIQLILNLIWSPIFFKYKNIKFSLIVLMLLIFFIILTIINFYKDKSIISAILLLPYLLWCFIAFYLNIYIVIFN